MKIYKEEGPNQTVVSTYSVNLCYSLIHMPKGQSIMASTVPPGRNNLLQETS